MTKNKLIIYLGDLSYFNKYSSSMITVPLNIGYIASYTVAQFGENVEVTLFNDAQKLLDQAKKTPPDILGLSCYFWNEHLDAIVAGRIKAIAPKCMVAIGGPNVDSDIEIQKDLYHSFKGNIDFLVINEGELGFANIVRTRLETSMDLMFERPIDGCIFFNDHEDPVVGKDVGLSLDLSTLPSPILTGLLDEFLIADYMPMIQTSRMCPYSCSFCSSGKLKGKLRAFPVEIVKQEIDYIALKYKHAPHRTLFITDENFGINKRDNDIAGHILSAREKFGFPRQTFCYFDKRLTTVVKEAALLFGEMNAGGLQLASQSFNDDALKAVKRKNMTGDEMIAAVKWAHDNGLKTSSEMIFGLPYETKKSFLDALEFLIKIGIDTIAAHNLFLLKGIELNRRQERNKFQLQTKFRPSFACSYGMVDGEFSCESEEIVVASSHFSSEDFVEVRKVSLMFYIVNVTEYYKKVFLFLIDNGQEVIPLFETLMNPTEKTKDEKSYRKFIDDFTDAAAEELFDTDEEVTAHLKKLYLENGGTVASPTRLNVFFASRLIYQEDWFPKILENLIEGLPMDRSKKAIAFELIQWSRLEWLDITNPDKEKALVLSREAVEYLKYETPSMEKTFQVELKPSIEQAQIIKKYNQHYRGDETSYYYNVLDIIQPRKRLRYETVRFIPIPN